MLNQLLFYALMLTVVGVPFFFRLQTQNYPLTADSLASINRLCARLSGVVILSLYGMSFLAFQKKSSGAAQIGFFSCLFSFFFLYSFRGKLVSKIREIPADPKERFQRSFRSLAAMSLLYGVYFIVTHFLIPITGTLPAVALAMITIAYATPLIMRIWMPTHRMHASSLKEEIMAVFSAAGNPVHEVYLIDTDRFKTYNALVCGPKYGFSDCKRSVFITKNLFEVLEPEEIKAVMCHEAAHFKLHHLFQRGYLGIGGMILSIIAVLFPIAFLAILFGASVDQNFGVLILSTLLTLVFQMSFLGRVVRKQEFEADLEALNLGTNAAALSSALEKVTVKNGASRKKEDWLSRFLSGHAHPDLEERLAAIAERKLPTDARIVPPWKYAVYYTSVVLLLGTAALFRFDAQRSTGQRLPATEIPLQADANTDEE